MYYVEYSPSQKSQATEFLYPMKSTVTSGISNMFVPFVHNLMFEKKKLSFSDM